MLGCTFKSSSFISLKPVRPTLAGIVKVACANGFADLIPVSALVCMELAQEQEVSGSYLQNLENIVLHPCCATHVQNSIS